MGSRMVKPWSGMHRRETDGAPAADAAHDSGTGASAAGSRQVHRDVREDRSNISEILLKWTRRRQLGEKRKEEVQNGE